MRCGVWIYLVKAVLNKENTMELLDLLLASVEYYEAKRTFEGQMLAFIVATSPVTLALGVIGLVFERFK